MHVYFVRVLFLFRSGFFLWFQVCGSIEKKSMTLFEVSSSNMRRVNFFSVVSWEPSLSSVTNSFSVVPALGKKDFKIFHDYFKPFFSPSSFIFFKTFTTSPLSNVNSSGSSGWYACLMTTCGQSHCSYKVSYGFSDVGGAVACSHRWRSVSDGHARIFRRNKIISFVF